LQVEREVASEEAALQNELLGDVKGLGAALQRLGALFKQ
jgi:hypothetical protein